MQISYPRIAIIILNWNGLQDTVLCLESLKKNNYPNYEVIIVDNGSEGNDADILKEKYGNYIKVIKSKENLGFPEGNNIAIEYAFLEKYPPDFVFLLNNDAVMEPNCLKTCVDVAKLSKAGIVGTIVKIASGEIVFWGTSNQPLKRLLDEFFGFNALMSYKFPSPAPFFWEVGRIQGCAMLISVPLLKEIKKDGYYLNSNFFIYCEEPDLCFRARKLGYKVVIARDAIVCHYYGKSMGPISPAALYYLTRNKISLARMILPWYFKILFNFWYTPSRLLRSANFLIKGKTKESVAIFYGLIDGYRGVKGKWKQYKQYIKQK